MIKFENNEGAINLMARVFMLISQISGVAGCLKHVIRGTIEMHDTKTMIGAKAYLKSTMGDLVYQMELLASELDLDFEEIRKIGKIRYEETKQQWIEKGYESRWI